MIEIMDKTDCCGCTACVSACPKGCISMKADEEGFLYPHVDTDRCVHCEMCVKVCPVADRPKKKYPYHKTKEEMTQDALQDETVPDAYVCCYNDDEVRKQSTSGGVFTALARYVTKRQGIVYGVGFDSQFRVKHFASEDLAPFRGSKYVQSDQRGIFKEIKQHLEAQKLVLYTGTPCQVAGLKAYLRKDYDNLITVDLFCHGTGSPLYWQKYLDYMTEQYHSGVKRACFREKTYGYNSTCMALYFENGKSSHKDHDSDLYLSPFSKCYIFRPSCYACAFKTVTHEADFSIGDYWDSTGLGEELEQAEGCTLMLCHSEKGKEVLAEVRDTMTMQKVSLYEALLVNGGHQPSMYITSSRKPDDRNAFMKRMPQEPIDALVREYMPMSVKTKLKCTLKPLLYKTGLLKIIKKAAKK